MFIVSIDQSHSNVLVFMRKFSSFNVASVNLGAGREEEATIREYKLEGQSAKSESHFQQSGGQRVIREANASSLIFLFYFLYFFYISFLFRI